MNNRSIRDQIIQELDHLAHDQQSNVLSFVQRLRQSTLPPVTPGKLLLDHLDQFRFPPGAVEEMMKAIDEDCERNIPIYDF